ncbi:hypothetical protein ACHAXR_004136 [Thalassiosira sp. AJA248-18]
MSANNNAVSTTTTSASASINMSDPATVLASTTPNSKPRQQQTKKLQTYVYQDFANTEPSTLNMGTCHERVPPQSLQSQKLPSKLAAMLCDPDLVSILTWLPHGRSWKIINRELFSSFALPRYFGHSNHASFVRIVNAWGFRRITKGPDRDSYYHEMFLRGKPRLHERMKRLPTCHRKTPVDKDDKCPDFYELAKTSPLPEVGWSFGGAAAAASASAGRSAARSNAMTMNQVSAGFSSNPMASLGIGNHNALLSAQQNLLSSGPVSSASAMESFLSNSSKQGNDMSSLLQLIRQQGTLQQQQQHQQQQQASADSNVMSQNLMNQILRMQNMNSPSSAQPNSLGRAGNNNTTLGQLANTFAQPPTTTSSSSNSQMLNSLTASMNMNGNQQGRRLSNDKISVNDVIQLRSIERTNDLLAQKLASMQQDTMAMKQNSSDDSLAGGASQSLPGNAGVNAGALGSSDPSSGGNTMPSKEEMLLQIIRRENQRNIGSVNPNSSNQGEENGNSMNQGLNHLLKSLTGMQQ